MQLHDPLLFSPLSPASLPLPPFLSFLLLLFLLSPFSPFSHLSSFSPLFINLLPKVRLTHIMGEGVGPFTVILNTIERPSEEDMTKNKKFTAAKDG